jgi:hypothetical protein
MRVPEAMLTFASHWAMMTSDVPVVDHNGCTILPGMLETLSIFATPQVW